MKFCMNVSKQPLPSNLPGLINLKNAGNCRDRVPNYGHRGLMTGPHFCGCALAVYFGLCRHHHHYLMGQDCRLGDLFKRSPTVVHRLCHILDYRHSRMTGHGPVSDLSAS